VASAVDFSEWVAPDLVLTLGERTYSVPPPSVERAKKIIAAAVRGEVNLGIVKGEIPAEVQEILDTFGIERPGLGPVYDQLVADEVPIETIDRMDYYSIFYWARGKEYADWLITVLWSPRARGEAGEAAAPKAPPRSPQPSGRSTA
jgi:hypothetical protein